MTKGKAGGRKREERAKRGHERMILCAFNLEKMITGKAPVYLAEWRMVSGRETGQKCPQTSPFACKVLSWTI